MSAHPSRESWLTAGVEALREHFREVEAVLPAKIRVSCGWPSKGGLSAKRRVVGQCWHHTASKDKHYHVFISPLLEAGPKILDVLLHELAHASIGESVGAGVGHKAPFQRLAGRLGLQAPWTNTTASPELANRLNALSRDIGRYPHGALEAVCAAKKETTRLLKVACSECGYTVRVTRKWLDDAGAPLCPCNRRGMEER